MADDIEGAATLGGGDVEIDDETISQFSTEEMPADGGK